MEQQFTPEPPVLPPVDDARDDAIPGETNHLTLGGLLRQARLKKGITQTELALKVGADNTFICRIENDDRKARCATETLFRALAAELGICGDLICFKAGKIPRKYERCLTDNAEFFVKFFENFDEDDANIEADRI